MVIARGSAITHLPESFDVAGRATASLKRLHETRTVETTFGEIQARIVRRFAPLPSQADVGPH